jgi:acyl-CoA reductase-like NAD-dependent aldehyde dehydrogenase
MTSNVDGSGATAPIWGLLIDGEFVTARSGEVFERVSPATGEVVGRFAKGGSDDVDQSVQAAREAFDSGPWPRSRGSERAEVLHQLADLLRRKSDRYARLESVHVGIPYLRVSWLSDYCADVIDFYAGAARMLFGRSMPIGPTGLGLTLREPVGVVAAITPWNFPLVLTTWKVAAALAAGCTMVVKPASQAPASILELGRDLLEAGLPPGVFNVITGPGPVVGEALVEHAGVDKVSFTGSTVTGKRVMELAARTVKRVSLELGGKSPLIVMPDADPSTASDAALECFFNSGQQCNVPSRLVVASALADEVIGAIIDKAERQRLGPDDDADLGPLVDEQQFQTVVSYVDLARSEGADILTGGERVHPAGHPGPYYPPTVIDQVEPWSRVVTEEIFGPVLTIQRFDQLDEAITLANSGHFGLAGGVFTADLDVALAVSTRLRVGTVWVNTWNKTYPELPTGGFKQSGLARELGLEGLDTYLETKTVQLNPRGMIR